jgi:excinuclease UvrABC ATPase subunit
MDKNSDISFDDLFYEEDRIHHYNDDDDDCKHCSGTGRISVESGSSLAYHCPDCAEYEEGE